MIHCFSYTSSVHAVLCFFTCLNRISFIIVNINIMMNLYNSLIYPILTYGIIAWGNTYPTTKDPLFLLQKKTLRLITFSAYREHTNPLFIKHQIIKFHDLIYYHNAIFVYNFHMGNLPKIFDKFFESVDKKHNYKIRLVSKTYYYLSKARTNYGKFNIRFAGVKACNLVTEKNKSAPSL